MSDSAPSPTQIKPDDQRPEHPDFWCKRFGEGITPWDAGKVPGAFADFIARQPTPLNTLIPGCGSAWEAGHLAEHGWPVTALDFSPVAVATARTVLGTAVPQGDFLRGAVDLVCDDFFTFLPPRPYQLIYERAFLCALPRKLWANWGRRVAELLPPRRPACRLLLYLRPAQRPALRHPARTTGRTADAEFHAHRGCCGQRLDSGVFRPGTLAGVAAAVITA